MPTPPSPRRAASRGRYGGRRRDLRPAPGQRRAATPCRPPRAGRHPSAIVEDLLQEGFDVTTAAVFSSSALVGPVTSRPSLGPSSPSWPPPRPDVAEVAPPWPSPRIRCFSPPRSSRRPARMSTFARRSILRAWGHRLHDRRHRHRRQRPQPPRPGQEPYRLTCHSNDSPPHPELHTREMTKWLICRSTPMRSPQR